MPVLPINGTAVMSNMEDRESVYSSNYSSSSVPVTPPGLEAIYTACRRCYPDQPNPLQVTALVKYWWVNCVFLCYCIFCVLPWPIHTFLISVETATCWELTTFAVSKEINTDIDCYSLTKTSMSAVMWEKTLIIWCENFMFEKTEEYVYGCQN